MAVAAAPPAVLRQVDAMTSVDARVYGAAVLRVLCDLRALEAVAAQIGYQGQIVARADGAMARAAFTFDWGEGRAAFDPDGAALRVAEALEAAIAAEGLHAEPMFS